MSIKTKLGRMIILVDDYDKAFDFYQKNFSCKKIFDAIMPDGQRYLHIGFSEDDSIGIWFLKAEKFNGTIGKQTAGQPTMVVYTEEIEKTYEHLKNNGVKIIEPLVAAEGSKFFHCLDLFGNRITVVEITKK